MELNLGIVVFLGLVWIVCSVLTWGLIFGFFQNKFPEFAYSNRWADMAVATISVFLMFVWAPLSLVLAFFYLEKGRYGLLFRPLSEEKSREAFQKKFPLLSRMGRFKKTDSV